MTIYQNYDELCLKTQQMPPHTDLLAFTQLYKRFGIECKIEHFKDNKKHGGDIFSIELTGETKHNATPEQTVSDKLNGVQVCHTSILFDSNGKFLEQGFYPY